MVFRSDGIGDFVMTTPFLRELRRHRPEYKIILCVPTLVLDLALRCPYVDHVICLPADITAREKGLRKYLALLRFAHKELLPLKTNITINPRFGFDRDWITLLQLFSAAPVRLGYTRKATWTKAAYDFSCDLLLTHVVPATPSVAHESIRGLNIIKALGISPRETHTELWVNNEDDDIVKSFMSAMSLENKKIFAVGLSAFSGRKLWPIERYQRIIQELAKKKMRCLLLGSVAEADVLQRIAEDTNCNAINLAGKLSLPQIYILLKNCLLFLGADSGLAHIAAIVCPTIVVSSHPYGGKPSSAYSPERFKPIGNQVYFIQPHNAMSPCSDECLFSKQHCIRIVTEEQVLEVIKRFL